MPPPSAPRFRPNSKSPPLPPTHSSTQSPTPPSPSPQSPPMLTSATPQPAILLNRTAREELPSLASNLQLSLLLFLHNLVIMQWIQNLTPPINTILWTHRLRVDQLNLLQNKTWVDRSSQVGIRKKTSKAKTSASRRVAQSTKIRKSLNPKNPNLKSPYKKN